MHLLSSGQERTMADKLRYPPSAIYCCFSQGLVWVFPRNWTRATLQEHYCFIDLDDRHHNVISRNLKHDLIDLIIASLVCSGQTVCPAGFTGANCETSEYKKLPTAAAASHATNVNSVHTSRIES